MTRVYSATGKRSLTNNTSIEKDLLFGNTNTLTIQLGKKGCPHQRMADWNRTRYTGKSSLTNFETKEAYLFRSTFLHLLAIQDSEAQ